jgi:predicted acylesterase/phospholipase RssA
MSEQTPASSDLIPRDRHLFAPGPKRILAIDGGGVRGVVALAFLAEIERTLEKQYGGPVRLCDHFDLIGGTSTGAIIATALALGYKAADIRDFYFRLGPRVFKRPPFRLPGWQAKFDAKALARELEQIVGARTLDSSDLQTGLGIMLKRIDTGSAWILLNNPRSIYWDTPADRSFIGNRDYSLASVVRASTAAPHYFDPQQIEIAPREVGLFVDGGLTPHNNPSLSLFLAVILPGHHLNWTTGPSNLTIVSIGAGTFRDRLESSQLVRSASASLALRAMIQQINDNQQFIMTMMSWFGEAALSWPINAEIGDLAHVPPPTGRLFRFLRYDLKLEAPWLKETLGRDVSAATLDQLRRFDDPDAMPLLEDFAKRAAQDQVREKDWGPADAVASPAA